LVSSSRPAPSLNEVVFDRVPGSQHDRVFQPWKRPHELFLHVRRKTHREAVDVDLAYIDALRFQKDLVPLPTRKPDDLVLERRTVSRPHAVI
jgi:hypothetical protein